MQVLGVIPARFGATRFPGKPLADIGGKTLVQHVWDRASHCTTLARVVVATEDERVAEHVRSFGGEPVLTRSDHASGTDRLGEVAKREQFDYYVNIQGDEPLLASDAVDSLVTATLAARANHCRDSDCGRDRRRFRIPLSLTTPVATVENQNVPLAVTVSNHPVTRLRFGSANAAPQVVAQDY